MKDGLTETQLRTITEKYQRILAYRRLAEKQQRSTLELALQFVLGSPAISVTLLGMRTAAHLQDNLGLYSRKSLVQGEYEEVFDTAAGIAI